MMLGMLGEKPPAMNTPRLLAPTEVESSSPMAILKLLIILHSFTLQLQTHGLEFFRESQGSIQPPYPMSYGSRGGSPLAGAMTSPAVVDPLILLAGSAESCNLRELQFKCEI
jgi:hypothetical protein